MKAFDALKRELLLVTLLCVTVLLLVIGYRVPPLPAMLALTGCGCAGAGWIVWRTRRVVGQVSSQEAEHGP